MAFSPNNPDSLLLILLDRSSLPEAMLRSCGSRRDGHLIGMQIAYQSEEIIDEGDGQAW